MQAECKFPFYKDPVTGEYIRTSVPILNQRVEIKFCPDYVPPFDPIDMEKVIKPRAPAVVVESAMQATTLLTKFPAYQMPDGNAVIDIPLEEVKAPRVPPPTIDVIHLHKENVDATQLEFPIGDPLMCADLHHDIKPAKNVGTNREALSYALAMHCSVTGICLAKSIGLFEYDVVKLGGVYAIKTNYRWGSVASPIYTAYHFDKPLWYSILFAHLAAARIFGIHYSVRTTPLKYSFYTSIFTKQEIWFLTKIQRLFPNGGHDAYMDAADRIKKIFVKTRAIEGNDGQTRLRNQWMVDFKRADRFGMETQVGFEGFLSHVEGDVSCIGTSIILDNLKSTGGVIDIYELDL